MKRADRWRGKAHGGGDLLRPLAAGIIALVVAMGIGRFVYTPILPSMQSEFGLSDQATGILASSNYLGYLLGAIFMTVFTFGPSQGAALRASLVAVVVSTGLMAQTDGFAAWVVLRFLAGLASAGAFILASGMVLGALNRRGRSDLAGWLYSGVGIGIAVAGLIVMALNALPEIPLAYWRADWIGSAAIAAVLVAVCWTLLPNSDGASATETLRSPGANDHGLWLVVGLLAFAYFLDGLGYIVTGTFLVKIVDDMPGLANFGIFTWVLVGLAAIPSTVLWVKVAARTGYVAALVVGYVAQAVGVILPVLSDSMWAAVGSAVLFGGTFIGIVALTVTFGRNQAPEQATRIIGTLTTAYGLGQVIGPLMAAALAGGSGDFDPALIAASAAVLFSGLLMIAVAVAAKNRERRKRGEALKGAD